LKSLWGKTKTRFVFKEYTRTFWIHKCRFDLMWCFLFFWRWLLTYIMADFYKLKDLIFHNNKNFIDIHIHVFKSFGFHGYQIAHNVSIWKNFHGFITWVGILILKPNRKTYKFRCWKLNERYKTCIQFLRHVTK